MGEKKKKSCVKNENCDLFNNVVNDMANEILVETKMNEIENQEDFNDPASRALETISTILAEPDNEISLENNNSESFLDILTMGQSNFSETPSFPSTQELTLTEKIQIDWSQQLYELCHKCKDLYNFADFITRKVYFLYTKNPNVCWEDFLTIRENIMPKSTDKKYNENKINLLETFHKLKEIIKFRNFSLLGNTLSTLLKYSKFYQNIEYAQSAQQINRILGVNWQIFQTNLNTFNTEITNGVSKKNRKIKERPNIPRFKPRDGEFMMIYTSQDLRVEFNKFKQHIEKSKRTTKYKSYSKTTAELLFPKRHRDFLPKIRVRYEILKRIREVRIIPKGSYYEIEIRYKKNSIDLNLNKERALAIDLGMRNPMTIVSNFGSRPKLIQGRQLKKANYFINKKTPPLKSVISICKDILKKYNRKNNIKSIVQILKEREEKYLNHYRLFEELVCILRDTPELTYEEFLLTYEGNKKIEQIFNHINELPDDEAKCKYLDYQYQEYCRRVKIYDQILTQLNTISSTRHKKSLKKLLEKKQQKLNHLYKIYSNHIRNANHKLSREPVNISQKHNVGIIVIGYNEGWKISSELNRAINRKFIPLPFYKLINLIKYKAQLVGIDVIVIDESYTSKCSALDKEKIEFHEKYAGIRNPIITGKDGIPNEHYGQFYSYISNKFIHSDVNGAFNIGRKGAPELFENIPQYQMLAQPKRKAIT